MKRSWLGFGLLILLLGAGILGTWAMDEVHAPVCGDLDAASRAALSGNWPKAAYHTALARQGWEKWALLRSGMTGHDPVEEVEALFAVLEVYGTGREKLAFGALAREIAEKIEAIGDAHSLVWKNFL